jgi:hypothetical protein
VKRKKSFRPALPKASDEMKVWSTSLAEEVRDWPKVSARSFFGFTALYRGDKMFAALPRTRAMESPNSLAFKLETRAPPVSALLEEDSRIHIWSGQVREARWFSFELTSDADIHGALDWLGRAYEAAAKRKKSKKSG